MTGRKMKNPSHFSLVSRSEGMYRNRLRALSATLPLATPSSRTAQLGWSKAYPFMTLAICSAPHVTDALTGSLLIRIFCSTSTTTSELVMVPPLGLIFQVGPSRRVLAVLEAAL